MILPGRTLFLIWTIYAIIVIPNLVYVAYKIFPIFNGLKTDRIKKHSNYNYRKRTTNLEAQVERGRNAFVLKRD